MDPRAGGPCDRRPGKFFAQQLDELLEFAEHQFRLDVTIEHGQQRRKLLEAVADRNPRAAADLQGPPCPEAVGYLLAWHGEVSVTRTATATALGFAPNPMQWSEVEAWARLVGVRLTPFELEALMAIDVRFLRACRDARGNGQ